MQKIVADAADVGACLEGVVPQDLGPVVGKVDIGFGAQPGQRHRITDQRAAENVCRDGDLPAAVGRVIAPVGAIAGDTKGGRVVGSIVCLLRRVTQMGQTDARLGKQGWREDVIVVEAGAIGRTDSGRFKSS